jgi:hypothetical protein
MKDTSEILLAAAVRTIVDGIHPGEHDRIMKISATYEEQQNTNGMRIIFIPKIVIEMKES